MTEYSDEVEYSEGNETAVGGFKFDTTFDVNSEYKVVPVIPAGVYEGFITAITPDSEKCALVWTVTLKADDDLLMSDGETTVNGNLLTYTNWFPKAGDEATRTRTGKMTKRQAKINMLSEFQKGMKINMNSGPEIIEAIQNAEWIGIEVIVTVGIRSFEGRISNEIKKMVAA